MIFNDNFFKYINEEKIKELDELLEKNKYEYVIDGMNVVYCSNDSAGINLQNVRHIMIIKTVFDSKRMIHLKWIIGWHISSGH